MTNTSTIIHDRVYNKIILDIVDLTVWKLMTYANMIYPHGVAIQHVTHYFVCACMKRAFRNYSSHVVYTDSAST